MFKKCIGIEQGLLNRAFPLFARIVWARAAQPVSWSHLAWASHMRGVWAAWVRPCHFVRYSDPCVLPTYPAHVLKKGCDVASGRSTTTLSPDASWLTAGLCRGDRRGVTFWLKNTRGLILGVLLVFLFDSAELSTASILVESDYHSALIYFVRFSCDINCFDSW